MICYTALRESPVEPRAWVKFIGRILEAAEDGEMSNDEVKEIIYADRRRGKRDSE